LFLVRSAKSSKIASLYSCTFRHKLIEYLAGLSISDSLSTGDITMLIRTGLLILFALALGACGIWSDYDVGNELKPLTLIRAGTYLLELTAEKDKPQQLPITLNGATYLIEFTNENGSKTMTAMHFYRLPEFDGYIMQWAGAEKRGYYYYYARVTNDRVDILDENIERAVLPPQLDALFVPRQQEEPGHGGEKRTNELKSGRDILFVLRALVAAKYPLKPFATLKRIG
jgi:hypothetical protein